MIQNTSSKSVTFITQDGMVFKPASGTSEQTVIGHLDASKPPTTLPTTGGTLPQTVPVQFLLLAVLGASALGLGVWIRSAGKSRPTSHIDTA